MGENLPDTPDAAQGHEPHRLHAFHILHESPPSSAALTDTSLVKAKRRRTSPQDHAVLEAAYLKNSKPDKTERAQIVSLVALGEKEVQIWFQNRRQNDRRRSKPLQPHELVAHLRNNTASPVPPNISSSPVSDDAPSAQIRLSATLTPIEQINRPASRASSIHDLLNPASSADTGPGRQSPLAATPDALSQATPPSSLAEPGSCTSTEKAATEEPATEQHKGCDSQSEDGSEQASARKRGHDEMTGSKSTVPAPTECSDAGSGRTREPLVRTASMVRLAMTVDGAVKIRTSNEPTPSPEKPRAPAPKPQVNKPRTSLVRSKSALNGVEVFRDVAQTSSPKPMAAGFGRSRDARTWEFYCDNNTNDALSQQAEAETAGSAVGAINLIRSNSFKSRAQMLSPSLSKTNMRPTPPTTKVSKEGRPKLTRAKSSLGRLQGLDGSMEPASGKPMRQGQVQSPSDDSDKENWAPGTRLSEHPLRRTQPVGRHRPILQENEGAMFPDAHSSRKQRRNGHASVESPGKAKAKGEDLDCVQSLLSLSQGAWK